MRTAGKTEAGAEREQNRGFDDVDINEQVNSVNHA